jgi:hypothetical protein
VDSDARISDFIAVILMEFQSVIRDPGVLSRDPFYASQRALADKITHLKDHFTEWKQAIQERNTAEDEDFKELDDAVRALLRSAEESCTAVGKIVRAVDKNPEKFALPEEEQQARRKFHKAVKEFLEQTKAVLNGDETQAKLARDRSQALKGSEAPARIAAAKAQALADVGPGVEGARQTQQVSF